MTTDKLIAEVQKVWKKISSKAHDKINQAYENRVIFDVELLGEEEFCLGGDLKRVYLLDNVTCQIHVLYCNNDSGSTIGHDILICSSSPLVDLDHIVLSSNRKQLVMYGKEGIYLMELHNYLLKGCIKKSSNLDLGTMACRCQTIYKTSQPDKYGVLKVRWHPHESGCLIALTNDDNLRFFNTQILNPASKMKLIPVKTKGKKTRTSSPIKVSSVLNQSVIDFDFCSQHVISWDSVSSKSEQQLLSILVLLGCGDIIHISGDGLFTDLYDVINDLSNLSTLSHSRKFNNDELENIIRTTLKISPQTEDNYGCDFVSFLCLRGLPNVVVMATSSGQIHHALLLLDKQKEAQSTNDGHCFTLCVIDRVDLDIPHQTEEADDSDHQILLQQSLYASNSYLIIHSFGVHLTVLPWLNQLRVSYIKSESNFDVKCLEPGTIVDFLLCTTPLNQTTSFGIPSVGIYEAKTGPRSKLILLLSSGNKMEAPIHGEASFVTANYPYHNKLTADISVTDCTVQGTSFEESNNIYTHIKEILQYDHNIPIFPSSSDEPITDSNCLERILTVFKAIQNGHLAHMKEARLVYAKRLRLITEQIRFQQDACQSIEESINSMRSSQQHVLQMCKNITTRSDSDQKRLSCLISCKGPLSHEELVAKQKIEKISACIKANLGVRLEQVKANLVVLRTNLSKKTGRVSEASTNEYDSLDRSNNNISNNSKICQSQISENTEKMKSLMKEEGIRIQNLVQKVKALNAETATID